MSIKRLSRKTRFKEMLSIRDIYFKYKNTHRLKVEEYRQIYYTNTNLKKGRVVLCTSDKAEFRTRKIIKDRVSNNDTKVNTMKKT